MATSTNPWNNNRLYNNGSNRPNLKKTSPVNRFQEAQKKLQEAVQKHIKNYDSSSDDEVEEDGTKGIVGKW